MSFSMIRQFSGKETTGTKIKFILQASHLFDHPWKALSAGWLPADHCKPLFLPPRLRHTVWKAWAADMPAAVIRCKARIARSSTPRVNFASLGHTLPWSGSNLVLAAAKQADCALPRVLQGRRTRCRLDLVSSWQSFLPLGYTDGGTGGTTRCLQGR